MSEGSCQTQAQSDHGHPDSPVDFETYEQLAPARETARWFAAQAGAAPYNDFLEAFPREG